MLYDWYETEQTITITFYLRKHLHDTLTFNLDHKVEATFEKATPAIWKCLTKKDRDIITGVTRREILASKTEMFDIDCLTDGEDVEGTLQGLLQKVYDTGNVDVRRPMNKTLMESEGTVLNTQWSSVREKKVELARVHLGDFTIKDGEESKASDLKVNK